MEKGEKGIQGRKGEVEKGRSLKSKKLRKERVEKGRSCERKKLGM